MKKMFPFIGIVAILGLVAYMETPSDSYHGFTPDLHVDSNPAMEESEEAVAQAEEVSIPTFSSLEYVLEETKEVDGYMIEQYREYEIYEDENGVVVKRVPTSNYDFLRYKIEEE
ncbi:hypothetical protein [Oceanobacillus salinisoli]|uniref:hypothetical protein n=1 Tax=Oceanobacillus salinisoli TaxID=2678611 RepID=UPI0012E11F12|nr:hypothetical protein [Oceanobacillus salinisoli]